jgi:hypothetical protein
MEIAGLTLKRFHHVDGSETEWNTRCGIRHCNCQPDPPRLVVSRIAGETPSGERVPMTPSLDAHGDPMTVEQMRRIRRRTKRANKKK